MFLVVDGLQYCLNNPNPGKRDITSSFHWFPPQRGLRATPVDTASVATALHSEQPVVPPEGGKAVEVPLVVFVCFGPVRGDGPWVADGL